MLESLGADICRVCLTHSQRLQRIDEIREEGEETPNEMLTQLLGVSFSKLNGKENIPDGICKSCKVELNMAFQFREKALQKQGEIEEYFRAIGILDEKELYYVKKEDDEDNSQVKETVAEYVVDDTEPEVGKDDEFLDVDSNEEQAITGDVEYLEDSYIEVDPEQQEVVLDSSMGAEQNAVAQHEYDDDDDDESPVQRENLLKPQRGRRARKVSSSTLQAGVRGEKGGYICDVCGNFYEKRGRMMEHRRRHDTECQYQCELCKARFQVREQLRKHMYSHTGSKPFKCSYCSRQFFYESVLKAHENVHRGIKPFVCKVCSRAFAYAHSLTKHELIHKDIKLYRCDYCNKDFRLLHHMRQHEETKCHQNAVMVAEGMMVDRDQTEEILPEESYDDDGTTEDY